MIKKYQRVKGMKSLNYTNKDKIYSLALYTLPNFSCVGQLNEKLTRAKTIPLRDLKFKNCTVCLINKGNFV